jgi:hypothetical protein
MAHFAELNSNNVVRRVIVISDDNCPDPAPDNESAGQAFIADVLGLAGEWKQTSYNGNFRGRYAGLGYRYDETLDAFITPQPFPSWTLDEATFQWAAPVPYPDDGEPYVWDENLLNWTPATLGD